MQPIDGLDIKALLAEARTAEAERSKGQVIQAITDMLKQRTKLALDLESAKALVAKHEGQLTGLDAKIERLASGDWSVLPKAKGNKDEKGEQSE